MFEIAKLAAGGNELEAHKELAGAVLWQRSGPPFAECVQQRPEVNAAFPQLQLLDSQCRQLCPHLCKLLQQSVSGFENKERSREENDEDCEAFVCTQHVRRPSG